eukprot:scaffold1442_cov128-Cylindrotheca_fusiformis.AAC.23
MGFCATTEADVLKVALNAHFGNTIGVVCGQDGALFKAIDSGELWGLKADYYYGHVISSTAEVHYKLIG